LLGLGVKQVVMTLGEAGSLFLEGSCRIEQPTFEVDVVDTTGASDAFVGAYCCGLVNGWSVRRTLGFASAAASLACTKHGTMSSMPTLAAVNRLLRDNQSGVPMIQASP